MQLLETTTGCAMRTYPLVSPDVGKVRQLPAAGIGSVGLPSGGDALHVAADGLQVGG